MKGFIQLIGIVTVLSLASCGDEPRDDFAVYPSNPSGTTICVFCTNINGTTFKASDYTTASLQGRCVIKATLGAKYITISIPTPKEAKYNFSNASTDATMVYYDGATIYDGKASGSVTISTYNLKDKIITGVFNAQLTNKNSTVKISSGEFNKLNMRY